MTNPEQQQVENIFNASIDTLKTSTEKVSNEISQAALAMVNTLQNGKKILACGNGGSAADAIHFTGELLNRFVLERHPLAAIALCADLSTITAIANDYEFEQIFSKQIEALGQQGDILLAISTSGNSKNILRAVRAAHQKKIQVVILSGNNGGELSGVVQPHDINICVPSSITARIQEVHGLAIHCFCDIIDQQFAI